MKVINMRAPVDPSKTKEELFAEAQKFFENGDKDGALSLYRHIASLWPNETTACILAATIYKACNNDTQAESFFRRAVEHCAEKNLEVCKIALAMFLGDVGRCNEALEIYEELLEVNPNSLDALVATGFLYQKIGNPRRARSLFERYIMLNPSGKSAECVREALGEINQILKGPSLVK